MCVIRWNESNEKHFKLNNDNYFYVYVTIEWSYGYALFFLSRDIHLPNKLFSKFTNPHTHVLANTLFLFPKMR